MEGALPVILAKRLLALAATVVIAPTVTYTVFNGLAGSLGEAAPGAAWHYVVRTFWHFDLGISGTYQQPVSEVLGWAMPIDLAMVIGGVGTGILLGLVGGVIAGARPQSRTAAGLYGSTALVLSCPPYWLGFMLLVLFAPGTGLLLQVPFLSAYHHNDEQPGSLPGWLLALWLPWVLVGLPLAAQVLRMTASGIREALGEDCLRTARAKGISYGRAVRRHALPLAVAPIAALTGANMALVITNVVLMESAFNLPGIFGDIRHIESFGDFELLQGMIIETTVLIVGANMLADAIQARLDPTIR